MSFDTFADRHIGVSNPDELKAMLDTIGVGSVDELIAQVIPQSIRLKKPLDLPAGMSEYEFAAHIRALADRNHPLRSFIGMGYYPCAVPAAVARNVFENPAWYTSYTPYQAEISQGRLKRCSISRPPYSRSRAWRSPTARSWTRGRRRPRRCS